MNESINHFIKRYGLVPLKALADIPCKPAQFQLETLQSQIRAAGLDPDDFYYNQGNTEFPYCYYRGMILLEFHAIDNKADEINTLIQRTINDINESVAKRDFDSFFHLVDSRLLPELYIEVFNFIPDQDKYRLFEQIWRFNEDSHTVFPASFIKKVRQYKGVTSQRPVADEAGYVQVYQYEYGTAAPEEAASWTIDVNTAVLKALALTPVPAVCRGRVHLDDIVSYDSEGFSRKLKVVPGKVQQLEKMPLINLQEFDRELNESGILKQYEDFSARIDNAWFHNPEGVHALGHTKRVLFLSLIIAFLEKFPEQDATILGLASIYHDIGRSNDGYDPEHGMASYEKVLHDHLPVPDNSGDNEILRFLIQNHAIPDQSAFKKLNHYDLADVVRTLKLYDAFKDADGLDRVRIRDLNPEYLRTGSAHRLLLAAHQLYSGQIIC